MVAKKRRALGVALGGSPMCSIKRSAQIALFLCKSSCSVIVHLHLNRSPRVPPLLHPGQPDLAGSGGLPFLIVAEHGGKAVVHVEGGVIVHLRVDEAAVQLGAHLVRLLRQLLQIAADPVAVIVDGDTGRGPGSPPR